MKAICVTADRTLEVRDVPAPSAPPDGHVVIEMEACAINHGDHTFLKTRSILGLPSSKHDIWGASGAGRVTAIGPGVPAAYAGKTVAIYRSLSAILSRETVGLWSEQALVHHLSCLILPGHVKAKDYSGSLVNLITAYAFLRQATAEGHRGIVATAGNSATGRALVEFARRQDVPVLALVRSQAAKQELEALGAAHVLDTGDPQFDTAFEALAAKLKATAVFEGVGGVLLSRLLPILPHGSAVWCYGFVGGAAPAALPTALLVLRNLTIKGFSNFGSPTVQDSAQLATALTAISAMADHPAFRTKLGPDFRLDQIGAAMENHGDAKSILLL